MSRESTPRTRDPSLAHSVLLVLFSGYFIRRWTSEFRVQSSAQAASPLRISVKIQDAPLCLGPKIRKRRGALSNRIEDGMSAKGIKILPFDSNKNMYMRSGRYLTV